MSTSGIYNYHPKVAHPNAVFPVQMASDTEQPPFFFGGSQVPVNLGFMSGSGILKPGKKPYKSSVRVKEEQTAMGRGLSATPSKHSKIFLSKGMPSLRK
jgi:hypothetical protein